MPTTDERVLISGTEWQEVAIDSAYYHDIQNVANVQLEWSYNNEINAGQIFNPGNILYNINKTIYVRAITIPKNTYISIVKKSVSETSSLSTIVDSTGRSNVIGVFGEQWATDVKNDILTNFSYGISTRDTKNETTMGTGSVFIQDDNMLTVSTGTDSNGKATIESYNAIRHRNGHTAIAHFTAIWTNPTANNTHQWIGLADEENGYAIGFYNGSFTIMTIRNSVHTHITEGFNGTIDLNKVDFTKIQMFRVIIDTIVVVFEMLRPDTNRFEPIHSIRNHNISTVTNIQISYLPIKVYVENNGNTTDCQVRSNNWQGGVMGFCQTCGNRPFGYPVTPGANIKLNIGTALTPIAAFRSKTTFQGLTNKIRAALNRFHFLPFDGDGIVTVQLISGATITGTEGVDYNFTDIDTDNSVMEVCTDLTAFTGGRVGLTIYSFPTTSGSKLVGTTEEVDGEKLGLFLDPNQVYIVAGQINVGTFDIGWAVNWEELF